MRVSALALLVPLLAACGPVDWQHLTSFGNSPRPEANTPATASAPQSAPAAPAPDPFCLAVARQDATTQGFDQATQGRVALRSYQQCVGLFGPSAPK